MQININENFGTSEGFLLQKESETFDTYFKKNVVPHESEINRIKESIENDRVTVVTQFDPEIGEGQKLMDELKASSMGTPLLVVVDPFAGQIDGMDQKSFYLNQGFEEMEVASGQGEVMVLK